jgi:hypothetical protein
MARVLIALFLDDEICDAEAAFLTLRTLRLHWDTNLVPAGVLVLGPESEAAPEGMQGKGAEADAEQVVFGLPASAAARQLMASALEYFDGVTRVPISQGWLAASHALGAARREGAALLFLRPGTLFLRPWTHLLAPPPAFTALAAPPHYASPSCALLWVPRASHDAARRALSLAESVGGAASPLAAVLAAEGRAERAPKAAPRLGGEHLMASLPAISPAHVLDAALARALPYLPHRHMRLLSPSPGGAAHLGRARPADAAALAMLAPPAACVAHLAPPHAPGLVDRLVALLAVGEAS